MNATKKPVRTVPSRIYAASRRAIAARYGRDLYLQERGLKDRR